MQIKSEIVELRELSDELLSYPVEINAHGAYKANHQLGVRRKRNRRFSFGLFADVHCFSRALYVARLDTKLMDIDGALILKRPCCDGCSHPVD